MKAPARTKHHDRARRIGGVGRVKVSLAATPPSAENETERSEPHIVQHRRHGKFRAEFDITVVQRSITEGNQRSRFFVRVGH